MIIDCQQNGLSFEFEEIDWKGDWQTLLEFVKAFDTWEYSPETNRWWIAEEHVEEFSQLKKQLIDNVINPNQKNLFEY